MTREEKIQNILNANQKVVDEAVKKGGMTPEAFAHLLTMQNAAIKAVNEDYEKEEAI